MFYTNYCLYVIIYSLWCRYAGSSFEIKIETDSNDAVEIKTEADSNEITGSSHDRTPSCGIFGFMMIFSAFVCQRMI